MRLYRNRERVDLPPALPTTRMSDRVLVRTPDGTFTGVAVARGDSILVSYRGRTFRFERSAPSVAVDIGGGSGQLLAPMPGLIVDVPATEGDELKRGAKVVVLEAMKTQMALTMPFDGVVSTILVAVGQQVDQDAVVATVQPGQTA